MPCRHGVSLGDNCAVCDPLDDTDQAFIARAKAGRPEEELEKCGTCGKRYLNPECGVCRSLMAIQNDPE